MTLLLGQFSVEQAAAARHLAAALRRLAAGHDSPGVVTRQRQGVVTATAVGPPPTCTVDFGGGAILAGVRYAKTYAPVVGEVVEIEVRSGNPTIKWALA